MPRRASNLAADSAEQQAALHRIARIVAEEAPPSAVFDAVAEEAARLLQADIAAIDRFDSDGMVTLLAARGVTTGAPAVGSRTALSETGNSARVHATGRPARVDNYTEEYSPVGYKGGFRSAVSVPITVAGRLWGAITVASRTEARAFPADTEARLTAMTELAAIALANAQAREARAAALHAQAALRRIALLVATGAGLDLVFSKVAQEVARLLDADTACVLRDELDGTVYVCGAWSRNDSEITAGRRIPIAETGVAHVVLRSGRTEAVERLDGPAASLAGELHGTGMTAGIGSPIRVQDRIWGLVMAAGANGDAQWKASSRQLEAFTDLVAIAITNAQAHAELEASRARVVASADEARRRIERDLHDGAQQRLVALSLRLRTAQQQVSRDQPELAAQLEQISSGLSATLDELRELARGIHPAILSRGELEPALRVLARRSTIPVDLAIDVNRRLPESAITTVYYTVAEALTNTAKHARASGSCIEVREADGGLRIVIRDDGIGGADPARGSGLIGLSDRVQAAAGSLTVSSPVGHGTELLVQLPIEPLPGSENGGAAARAPRS